MLKLEREVGQHEKMLSQLDYSEHWKEIREELGSIYNLVRDQEQGTENKIQETIERQLDYKYATKEDIHQISEGLRTIRSNMWLLGSILGVALTIVSIGATLWKGSSQQPIEIKLTKDHFPPHNQNNE